MALTVYQYPKCSTCRKALQWLDAEGIAYRAIDLVKKPPSKNLLKKVRRLADVPVRKLFNTSGQSYRDGGFKKKLETMSDDDAFEALSADGKLIKRPLAVGNDFALIGFRANAWSETLHP